ncbi:MAG: SAM-dependent chlorinase/fluorinase [Bacteroidales bacterium]|nr:SAM-dependent chlorinase/fluorinase [Bacteroidales bacterium]
MYHVVIVNDWKDSAHYKALIEGQLYCISNNINIHFIKSNIETHDIFEGGLILRTCYFTFPENTILLNCVKSVSPPSLGYIYVYSNKKHIFTANNGIISYIIDNPDNEDIIELNYKVSTFPEVDIFLPYIKKIVKGEKITGPKIKNIKKITPFIPIVENDKIIATVIQIDSYGNAITNISKSLFYNTIKDRNFIIYPGTKSEMITQIVDSYYEVESGNFFALFNIINLLEIGIINDNLCEAYGIKERSNILIEII